MHAWHVFDLRTRYPEMSDLICQMPGCVRRQNERGGVDEVQAIEWWACITDDPFHATSSAHTTVGLLLCWSDGLELTAWRHAGSRVFCRQLQTVTEDIFIFAVLVCSVH